MHALVQSSWSALTIACRKNYEDIARVLVEHGADVNQKKDVILASYLVFVFYITVHYRVE